MAKLITETVNEIQILHEEAEGKKTMYVSGPFLQAEIVNKNGRKYSMPIMEREVIRYVQEKVNSPCGAGGELNHPASATLNLDRIALKVQSLTRENNNFIGKAKICGPLGHMARGLIEDGFGLGVSSRGIGSLTDNKAGYKDVAEDFKLCVAADLVSDPSGPDCFVNGIMEGTNFHWDEDNGWMEEFVSKSRKGLDLLSKEDREQRGLKLVESYFLTFLQRNS
jgi:Prohead core protein serine protease